LDLPVIPGDPVNMRYQILQFLHRRPIFAASYLKHLQVDSAGFQVVNHPAVSWLIPGPGHPKDPPETITEMERQQLIDFGFRFLVLHERGLAAQRYRSASESFSDWFGPPRFTSKDWICWDLVGVEATPTALP
jgi:hypothetical protein